MELMTQELLEEEATEFLQRGHYERKKNNSQKGYWTGDKTQTIKTGAGVIS